jgi:hypothetical protein
VWNWVGRGRVERDGLRDRYLGLRNLILHLRNKSSTSFFDFVYELSAIPFQFDRISHVA